MSKLKSYDPFELWKNAYDQAETYWSKVLDENLATDDFSRGLGKVLDMNLQYKKIVNDSTKQYLEQMNMPSKDDLASLAKLVINVETKVDQMDEVVEDFVCLQEKHIKLTNELYLLKDDMKKLHKKVDEIMEYLKNKS